MPYKSPYEAYPFLADDSDDLRCDFELLTDLITSEIGLLAALAEDAETRTRLARLEELVYHANPTLRTRLTLTAGELAWLAAETDALDRATRAGRLPFVLPRGGVPACRAHVLRVYGKMAVRLLYRHAQGGHEVPDRLLDFFHLLSGYFHLLALRLNAQAGIEETAFISRNYG
ncbi:MAG: ATP:cob(I)alamin adenosyltransferase [Oscillospiraceae bacterium]|jgi:cob(I)alamin adenosyltransferase|nr:ATP:cob(I)alamin adenosyltransferase [Oscillospiraceae bacterium]